MRRVLVTGAGGQIGRELIEVLTTAGYDVTAATSAVLDVADAVAVGEAVQAMHPDVVVNAAAWTDVDACEDDPVRAEQVNGAAVAHLVAAAADIGATVCQLSTDYVFDGRKAGPYREDDEVNPLSAYGRSKVTGERALRPDDLLVRTAWVSGRSGRNVVAAIRAAAAERHELCFVDDQRGSPTVAADLAGAILALIDARTEGTFHVTNQGEATWFDVAQAVMAGLGLDPGRVRPVATAELDPPRRAPRPANSVLDNAALRREGIALLPHWRERFEELAGVVGAGR